MISLSVNVNKVATLRNSRGGERPSPAWAARVCIAAGAQGITVHPRADQRHIRPEDVREIAGIVKEHPTVEFNIEGDPRPDWIDLVLEVAPHQATLVPVKPGEITSDHGYRFPQDSDSLRDPVARIKDRGLRVSVFAEAGVQGLAEAKALGIDRIELYTEPYARASEMGATEARSSFDLFAATAREAARLGLGVNAGHDLDLRNLPLFSTLPGLCEVSIGHALMSDALEMGLDAAVREYLSVLSVEGR